jgi:hypothetical protein
MSPDRICYMHRKQISVIECYQEVIKRIPFLSGINQKNLGLVSGRLRPNKCGMSPIFLMNV